MDRKFIDEVLGVIVRDTYLSNALLNFLNFCVDNKSRAIEQTKTKNNSVIMCMF